MSENKGSDAGDSAQSFERKSRCDTPSYEEVLRWDPMLQMPTAWREDQLKDQARWSRRYLLPTVKVVTMTLIVITRIIKRILPFKIYSWRALNFLSTWFVKRCMSSESQRVLFRHFALEASVINFIAKNSGAESVETVGLYPVTPDELGDWDGLNATLLHDCNVMNLFIDLGNVHEITLTF